MNKEANIMNKELNKRHLWNVKNPKKNQRAIILRHLILKKTITSIESFSKYMITRLSAIIFDLRVHYKITMHKPNKKPYGIYTYRGRK